MSFDSSLAAGVTGTAALATVIYDRWRKRADRYETMNGPVEERKQLATEWAAFRKAQEERIHGLEAEVDRLRKVIAEQEVEMELLRRDRDTLHTEVERLRREVEPPR